MIRSSSLSSSKDNILLRVLFFYSAWTDCLVSFYPITIDSCSESILSILMLSLRAW